MAQKFCSFCCCSFCSLPSRTSPPQSSQQEQQPISSPPQHQTITPQQQSITSAHSSSSPSPPPPQSSQQQQQPISSPPQQPSITSAHSSPSPPSSSSQSSQQQQQPISSSPRQPSITSAPSSSSQSSQQQPTPTITDFKKFLQKFKDAAQIHSLIQLLEELLKVTSGEQSGDIGSNSAAGSYIQDGQAMLEMLNTRIGKHPAKNNSRNDTVEEIKKVCMELLKGSEKIPTVGIALCMLGSVLERFIKASDNRKECLSVLKRMVDLGKQILMLNELIPEQKEKLDEGVECIIEGTIMCISQLARTFIPSFITATVNMGSLNAFHGKVDHFCSSVQLWTEIGTLKRVTDMGEIVVDIQDRVPKNASESQNIYGYQPTFGIEGAQDKVIQLLDLTAQDPKSIVVLVHGFGGIGKTTLADAVYKQLNLQSYKYCRVHMEQECTKNDIKGLQEQILNGLFGENIKLKDCDEGQGKLWTCFRNYRHQPLFLYIDNGLKNTDLAQLLPKRLDMYLPPKSRIIVTTRNLNETRLFSGRNIERREYDVNPLPYEEGRKLLLEKVWESPLPNEANIVNLVELCGGVPLLLELAGSQLAINKGNTRIIVLEMLREGEEVKGTDMISDRMVGFVYDRLDSPFQEAFLDIASFFYDGWSREHVSSMVGEQEFRALEAASFVKTSVYGEVTVHDIIRARGKKLSEGNRFRDDRDGLSECLKDNEKLKKIRGIYLGERYARQTPIEINCHHLNCMSDSLRVLRYHVHDITFTEICQKPFEQLRYLRILLDVRELPMQFEKLDHLVYYKGPFTQGMNWYEFPPSLRFCEFTPSKCRVECSKVPPNVIPPTSLVELQFNEFRNMQRMPDGVEKLTKLERLTLSDCFELRELPSKLTDLSDLRELTLFNCNELKELPSDFGQLKKLKKLDLTSWAELVKSPSDFGQLKKLETSNLSRCCRLRELPLDFGQLKKLETLNLSGCSDLRELPLDFGELQNLEQLNLNNCFRLEKWPLSFGDLTKLNKINLEGCSSELKDSLPKNITENNCKVIT